MRQLNHMLRFMLAIWFAFWVFIGFFILYPGFLYTLSNPKRYSYGHQLRRIWGIWNFFWGGVRVKQVMEKPIDHHQPFVIVPNHTSYIDIITLCVKLRLNFNFMAKIELAHIPLFGIFFRTIDIGVDRKNMRHAAKAYQQAGKQLDSGRSIVIFPEGTIPTHTPKLGRFKEGAFRLAIEKQVDLLPVTIIGNWEVMPDQGQLRFMPGKVTQFIHAPISTKGMTLDDIETMKQKVFHIIESKLIEHGYQQRTH